MLYHFSVVHPALPNKSNKTGALGVLIHQNINDLNDLF